MAQRIDQFYEDLRVKLRAIDDDLRSLKAKIDEKAEHVEQEGQKHLDSVRKRVEQNRDSAAAARDEMKSWVESRKAATAEKVAEWKVNRDISKLQRYADQAERYAEAAEAFSRITRPDHTHHAFLAAIFAQMCRDSVGTGRDGDFRRLDRIRVIAAAGVAQGGDVIDVDAEAQRWSFGHGRTLNEFRKRSSS